MENNINPLERKHALARIEIGIWDALIGAQGSPMIQKFAIQQRLYAFVRTSVGIENDDLNLEMRQVHLHVKKSSGKKIKQFIDFIEGDLSLEEAMTIKNALQESLQDASIFQLASA